MSMTVNNLDQIIAPTGTHNGTAYGKSEVVNGAVALAMLEKQKEVMNEVSLGKGRGIDIST